MDTDVNVGLDDELLAEFINESREHLTTIETDLLAVEEDGANIDAELVNKVFRAAHSIKGASGYFGLTKVKELAHRAETVLDMIRSKKMPPNAEITNLLLAAFDRLREMINHPQESANADIDELVVNLTGLASSFLPQEKKASLTETVTLEREGGGHPFVMSKFDYERSKESGNYLYWAEYDLIQDIERRGQTVLEVFRTLFAAGQIVDCEVDFEAVGTLNDAIGHRLPLRLILATIFKPDDIDFLFPHNRDKVKLLSVPDGSAPDRTAPMATVVQQAPKSPAAIAQPAVRSDVPVSQFGVVAQAPGAAAPGTAAMKPIAGSVPASPAAVVEDSIRVNVATLEMLMNLAGELVLGRNQLRASIAQKNPRALKAADQRINQITSELQDVVMQTRLQPIGNVFGKFPRLVRDLAASLKKDIQLEIRGKDVALDRSLIESLSDPLTHMVRNAVDHGIEPPEDRLRAGKGRQGLLSIDARHEAGQVVVEIVDDGKGIDPERIGKVALTKGLITAEKLEGMTAKDKMSLIFLPGLSTNTEVSDISGRGVGMDVVKTNLDRLGGKVEIISTLGKGTTFRIKLPLTLAIIPSLIVSVEGERFAIPQINVEEMRHVLPGQAKTRIEIVGDAEVLLLRDRLIPLVRFADLLGVVPTYVDANAGKSEVDRRTRLADRRSPRLPAPGEEQPEEKPAGPVHGRKPGDRRHSGGALEIVVVNTGTQTYGLVVGSFHDTEEIVVKPLGSHLKGLEEYAGATILGDGSVALILDVAGLGAKANLDAITRMTRAQERSADAEEQFTDSHSLVLFHNAPDVLCALPLDTVARIEKIAPKRVETIGGRRTMQYHGGILPLVTLSDAAQVEPIGDSKELAVMIANIRGHEVGLLGAMPVDVIETGAQIDQTTHRQKGVAGSTIINNRTALVVDLYELVDAAWPEWAAEQSVAQPRSANAPESAVLLAEDSDFFRAQVTRFLSEDGYPVLAAPDGEAAWELLLKNLDKVRAVVTDIEMPRLDGLGLARRIRADKRTEHLPIVALTSLAGDEDIARGKAAGINDYQTKLDREQLLERLREYLGRAAPESVASTGSYAAA
ncbi:MAG: chemotaxis protein CheW [Terracidiphilus sp.]|jgi:two-component system chemotaxis sensor kinase CheA